MEGVEGLYKKFGVLADAKDKAGEYEEEYLSILSTISNGSDAEKRLCASFIPRFFKSFPNHQEAAFNAQLDLCEAEEAVIRREAIKGLPDLCKADPNLVARMSSVLAQLLPIEGHLDQTIVKHCLVQLLKQDPHAAVSGIVKQIVSGEDSVRGPAKKFFLERLADSDKYVPTLQSDEKLKAFIIEQLDNMSKDGLYDEFVELMQVAGGIDRKKTVKTLTKLLDMEKTFDPSNTEQLERFAMILPVVLKHHTKTNNTSAILKYYGTILPLFSQIESETHKIMLLQGLAETTQSSLTEEDAALCLDGIYSILLSYLPENVPTDDEIEEPPSLNFSALECVLFALNKTACQVPSFLKEESRLSDVTPKLNFVLRCCTCFAKRLKGSSIGDDTPDKVKLKTKAYKTCNNTKELARGLVSTPLVYKSDINFSWKVDLTNVTNRLFTPLASDTKRAPHPKPPISPTPKRRRQSDSGHQRRSQQVYAPPQGRYSGSISGANGKEESKRDRKRF
ncbi:hypothetical protein ACHWQZ_G003850 [Mnemiopsis leidyi]